MISLRFLKCSLILLFLVSCAEQSSDNKVAKEEIVAIVADDTIFVNDFIRRCEYTIRPVYCQDNGYHDKAICLNSLIAEKLFAIEMKDDTSFMTNRRLAEKLQGIKEQAMRQMLIGKMIVEKIKIPEIEIKQAYINSQKTVFTESVFIPDHIDPEPVYRQTVADKDFKRLRENFPGVSEAVENEVKWGQMDEEVQKSIFSKNIKKGSVIKPIKTKDGYWLIRIVSWKENIELSQANRNQKMENIRSRLKDYYIRKNYKHYAREIMKGKRIDFIREGWRDLVAVLKPVYLPKDEEITLTPAERTQIDKNLGKSGTAPLLRIDDKIWTIDDLRTSIRIHPLVLDTKLLTEKNFEHHLQAAIAGLLTDLYLTERAYENNYDQATEVKKEVATWQTYFAFLFQRDNYLTKRGFKGDLGKDYFEAYDQYLTPYLDTLKFKYNSAIVYNPEVLNNIEMTKIPMIIYRSGGPYRQIIPPFPLVTNSAKANYQKL